ncbi:alpha/beta fold hydrolase [Naasia lichenicola]|uniref:Alpha/beta hydrolase n=1 Tax=Naasia lichenicola TaxID=2565933 RepID=A0A4S4FHN4_9MICO|nr:alpha/beta hydrolase [Naasia lichenicola]THG29304.1 alpha/beta hydrolase [Naasia lichenicola]
MTPPPIVLIHGAWHGAWVWDVVTEQLRDRGYDITAIDLPGVGRTAGDPTLSGHAQYLRDHLINLDRPPLLVAHSYGGAVLNQALTPGVPAARLLYLAAFLLDTGETCMAMNGSTEGSGSGDDAFEKDGDYIRMPADASRTAFYNDVPSAQTETFLNRMTAEHRSTVYAPVTNTPWKTHPAAYVICDLDQAILPSVQQRMAERASTVYRLRAGHSAMVSDPTAVAAIIESEALRTP